MTQFSIFSKLFARLLRSNGPALYTKIAADLSDVRIPHSELDLNGFWAFPHGNDHCS
jgi:hypothetical protein